MAYCGVGLGVKTRSDYMRILLYMNLNPQLSNKGEVYECEKQKPILPGGTHVKLQVHPNSRNAFITDSLSSKRSSLGMKQFRFQKD
jgi:hypothetical protein